ncbi:MAG: ABC transporter permease [Clostridiales bacterium]|nr:ABC transporter permease [Clostridiales bacterium]
MKKLQLKNDFSHFKEMFVKYKYLLSELTRKNVKLKYRDSWLGIVWSFLQPLLNMIVLTVVFGNLLGRDSSKVICYPIYLFTGRLMYEFFTSSTKKALMSFRVNAGIIKKVYVPKYMYPLSGILSNFVTFAISIICLICVWVFFKLTGIQNGSDLTVTWHALFCWVPMLIMLIFVTGVGLILSVLHVYFRDVEYIWDVACTLMFYMVPIIYHFSKIETDWIIVLIKINPLYSMIELFRQCVLYSIDMSWKMLLYSFAWAVGTLALGIFVFNKKSDDLIFHM